jgi:hypothetical protein
LDSFGSGYGPVEGCCEQSSEPSGSIKCWGSSWVAAQPAASQEGLISMELKHFGIKQTFSCWFVSTVYMSVFHLNKWF